MTKQRERELRKELKLRNQISALLIAGMFMCITMLVGLGFMVKNTLSTHYAFSTIIDSQIEQSVE